MPLTTLVANTPALASDMNNNFALCVLTDTARTITASHTFSGAQSFTGGITGPLTVASGTITSSSPALTLTQTWNAGAVTFNALSIAITDTTSAAASTLMTAAVGSLTVFNITKAGSVGTFSDSAAARFLATSASATAATGSQIATRRSRGTTASPTVITTDDVIGEFRAEGYNGTTFIGGLSIRAFASEAWSGSVNGSYVTFRTVLTGATSFSDRITIDGAGLTTYTGGIVATTASFTTGTFSSTLAATGNFAINTNKFTVTAASGNTVVAGTLAVTDLATLTGGLQATTRGFTNGASKIAIGFESAKAIYWAFGADTSTYGIHRFEARKSDGTTIAMLEMDGAGGTPTAVWGSVAHSGITTLLTTGQITSGAAIQTSAPTGGAGAWELGIANSVSPTSPNRTLTVEIGGTAYYIHAKTTND